MNRIFSILALALIVTVASKATVIEVPVDFATIQAAINASADGDTIIVFPGTYLENINFRGKNVILTSLFYLEADTGYITSTIIEGGSPTDPDTASCVIFSSGEDSTAVIQGFTITGGGGIRIGDGNPIVANNTIMNNQARYGAGIVLNYTGARIVNNVITSNTGGDQYYGGSGIWICWKPDRQIEICYQ